MNNVESIVSWIISKSSSDDQKCLEAYYKSPIALYLNGKPDDAANLYDRLNKRFDLCNYRDSYTKNRKCDCYYLYWIYMYLYLAGNKDKEVIYARIKDNYINKLGGFLSVKENRNIEMRATAFAGICAFLQRDYYVGISTADYLVDLVERNRKNRNHFYMLLDADNLKVLEIESRLNDFYSVESKPLYYAFSLSIILLAFAYEYKNEYKYLEVAEKLYFLLIREGKTAVYNNYIGKFGVATAILYRITHKSIYEEYLEIVEQYLTENLQVDHWENYENDSILSMDRTSELLACIEIMKMLMLGGGEKTEKTSDERDRTTLWIR